MDQEGNRSPQWEQLQTDLAQFLSANCHGMCLDNDVEREELATLLADHLLRPREGASPERNLPPATHKLGLRIVDRVEGKLVVALILNRDKYMADGD